MTGQLRGCSLLSESRKAKARLQELRVKLSKLQKCACSVRKAILWPPRYRVMLFAVSTTRSEILNIMSHKVI